MFSFIFQFISSFFFVGVGTCAVRSFCAHSRRHISIFAVDLCCLHTRADIRSSELQTYVLACISLNLSLGRSLALIYNTQLHTHTNRHRHRRSFQSNRERVFLILFCHIVSIRSYVFLSYYFFFRKSHAYEIQSSKCVRNSTQRGAHEQVFSSAVDCMVISSDLTLVQSGFEWE